MQKVILTLVLTLTSFFLSYAQETATYSITVNISGMKSDEGSVLVALYNSEKNFLKNSFKGSIGEITDKKASVVFKNIKKGAYALSVFHDENNNKKMDTRVFGIPKERYGSSNGARGFMGPPKFKDAEFMLYKDLVTSIIVE